MYWIGVATFAVGLVCIVYSARRYPVLAIKTAQEQTDWWINRARELESHHSIDLAVTEAQLRSVTRELLDAEDTLAEFMALVMADRKDGNGKRVRKGER